MHFTIIKFLEVVSTYVVFDRTMWLFVKCLYSLITLKVGKVVAKNDQAVWLMDHLSQIKTPWFKKLSQREERNWWLLDSAQTLLFLLSGWIASTIFDSFPRAWAHASLPLQQCQKLVLSLLGLIVRPKVIKEAQISALVKLAQNEKKCAETKKYPSIKMWKD